MANDAESEESLEGKDDSTESPVEVVFFKSNTCAFCPRAEEVLTSTLEDFAPGMFVLEIINVSQNPEAAEEYGIFALPTIVIGGVSVTGIPEPDMIMKMFLGAKVSSKRGASS
ncbi:MAG: glutaredoxin family protein [Candidatus Thorarchaeota archaeon]